MALLERLFFGMSRDLGIDEVEEEFLYTQKTPRLCLSQVEAAQLPAGRINCRNSSTSQAVHAPGLAFLLIYVALLSRPLAI